MFALRIYWEIAKEIVSRYWLRALLLGGAAVILAALPYTLWFAYLVWTMHRSG